MALLKVWLGAFAALVVFLCLQGVLSGNHDDDLLATESSRLDISQQAKHFIHAVLLRRSAQARRASKNEQAKGIARRRLESDGRVRNVPLYS